MYCGTVIGMTIILVGGSTYMRSSVQLDNEDNK